MYFLISKQSKQSKQSKKIKVSILKQLLATYTQAEVVTEENISQFTIFDVVMPMIGKSVQFPPNEELKALYDKYMKEDGITIEMFESKSMESGCAHGAYRHIGRLTFKFNFDNFVLVARAKDIEWDTVEFNDEKQDLLNPYYLTDGHELEVKIDEKAEKKFKALRIKFSLPPSTYATIFVRELTHQ
jgi:tRNA pseudouridine13 synthase